MKRSGPIKRYTPVRKKRATPRRGQPTAIFKQALRIAVRERANGTCQIRLHKQCWGNKVLPLDGDVFERGHLVHLKSVGSGGLWDMKNCIWGCPPCHLGSMHTEGKNPDLG